VIAHGLVVSLLLGCGPNVFACDEDSDCASSDSGAQCEVNGYCSFPDESCASGRRYGDRSPAGIAGTCTPVGEETGEGTGMGPTTTAMSSSAATSDATQSVDDTSTSEGPSPSTSANTSATASTSPPTTTEPDDTSTSASASTSMDEVVVEVVATLAVCTEVGVFDTEHCALEAGPEQFTLDSDDVDGNVSNGWLRFDLDDALEGAAIVDVQLVLRVGSDRFDESDQSGELWTVAEFDAGVLAMGDPTPIELVAADLGVVALDAEVVFDVSPDLVVPSSALCFGLFPSTSDGLDYWGHGSDDPPRLVITALQ
jgi:hypothetical protein